MTTTNLFCFYNFVLSWMLHKWNHTICNLLLPAFSSHHNFLEIHLGCVLHVPIVSSSILKTFFWPCYTACGILCSIWYLNSLTSDQTHAPIVCSFNPEYYSMVWMFIHKLFIHPLKVQVLAITNKLQLNICLQVLCKENHKFLRLRWSTSYRAHSELN